MSDMITRSIIIKAEVATAYKFWENFENFPLFMQNIKSVTYNPDGTSHWVMRGPLGKDIEWDAQVTRLEDNQRLAWSTKDNEEGDITTSGQVTFTPLSQGETQVTVQMQYIPRKGLAGDIVEKLFAHPEKQLEEDLKNFKARVEAQPSRAA